MIKQEIEDWWRENKAEYELMAQNIDTESTYFNIPAMIPGIGLSKLVYNQERGKFVYVECNFLLE